MNWREVGLFYAIACAWSWPSFWLMNLHPQAYAAIPMPHVLKGWLLMWGPGIAALTCRAVFRRSHRRTVSAVGTSLKRSLAFYLTPLVLLFCIRPELGVVQTGTVGLVSIVGEELGWRGFLLEALDALPARRRYVLIGGLWEFWHFTNRFTDGHPTSVLQIAVTLLISYSAAIVLSMVMGAWTNRTGSLCVPVTIHLWVDCCFQEHLGWVAALASIPVWIVIIQSWKPTPVHGELVEPRSLLNDLTPDAPERPRPPPS